MAGTTTDDIALIGDTSGNADAYFANAANEGDGEEMQRVVFEGFNDSGATIPQGVAVRYDGTATNRSNQVALYDTTSIDRGGVAGVTRSAADHENEISIVKAGRTLMKVVGAVGKGDPIYVTGTSGHGASAATLLPGDSQSPGNLADINVAMISCVGYSCVEDAGTGTRDVMVDVCRFTTTAVTLVE